MLAIAIVLIAANIAFSACFYVLMRKRFSPERVLRDVEKELNLLYKDLQRETDSSLSIIEDRTAALKSLIAAADKRILLAASEIEKREKASSFAARPPAAPIPEAPQELPSEGKADEASKSDAAEEGAQGESPAPPAVVYTKRQIIEKALEPDARKEGAAAKGIARIPPETPAREKVVLLARQDISPDEIAKILSLPRSEVDLILALDL